MPDADAPLDPAVNRLAQRLPRLSKGFRGRDIAEHVFLIEAGRRAQSDLGILHDRDLVVVTKATIWGCPDSSDRSAFEFYVDGFSPSDGAV